MPLKDFQALVSDKPELLKEVEQVFEKAEAAAKIQQANQEISRERDELKGKLANVGTEKAGLETAKKDLEAKLAELQKGIKPDEAVINGFKEQITQLSERLNKADAEKAEALQKQQATELKNSIIAAAGKAINPNQVFALMQTDGLVGIKDGAPFFHKLNEQGAPVALKPEEAVESFLKANPHLEKASGTAGSGGNPKPNGTPTATGLLANPEAVL